MNTKEVCKSLNISPKALRIYEDYGIVVPQRNINNYRNYEDSDIVKLRQIILLKEIGFPLKNIKVLLSREYNEENKIVRGLDLQLKAVENKIYELENIKAALNKSINEVLENPDNDNYDNYFNEIGNCLKENREIRTKWIDKWGFDSWAENYDKSIMDNSNNGLNLFEKYDYVLETVVKKIRENNALKVLDIGCGTGNLINKLDNYIKYTGVDQSIEMLLTAKKKFPNINFRLGNFLDEPFINNEFDMIISTFAFHHLKTIEKEKAVNFMLKYLKPKGRIIIADLMFLNEKHRIEKKEYFINKGREDLWNIVEDEYYTNIERIKKYSELLGCNVKYKHLVNFTWIIEIEK